MRSATCTPEFDDKTREMMARVKELREQLKATQRDATRLQQLEKQSAQFREKIAAGDTSRPEKRQPIEYGDAVMRAMADRNRLRMQVEDLIAKGDRLNQSSAKKVMGIVHDLGMASILASAHVYKKLAWAVGETHVGSLTSDVTRSAARHVPGIKQIAEQSPQYGRGVDLDALKARWQGIKEAPKEALNQLRHGMASREAAFGNPVHSSNEFFTHAGRLADALATPGALNKTMEVTRHVAGIVGRTHAAEKEFVAQPEWREGIARETKFLVQRMMKEGKSADEINRTMQSEAVQAAIGTKALERAYDSKLQGKNALSSGVNALISGLDKSNSTPMNFLGFLLKRVFPVRNVPVNAVIRGTDYLAGGVKAALEAARKGDMTRERADYIMRSIGRQGTGAALMLAGWVFYQSFGGIPGVLSKKQQQRDENGEKINPGEGAGLGSEAFHGPEAAVVQIGASMAQLFHKEYGKEKGTELALDVLTKPTANWMLRTIPYTDTPRRWKNTMEYGRARKGGITAGLGQIVAENLRSILVPGVVQQYAAAQDPRNNYPEPRNMWEDIASGIPGLRENVPVGKQRRPDRPSK